MKILCFQEAHLENSLIAGILSQPVLSSVFACSWKSVLQAPCLTDVSAPPPLTPHTSEQPGNCAEQEQTSLHRTFFISDPV